MGVSWNKPDEKPVGMIADRDLWLDKSGERLAREGSAEAASLLMGKGREIDPADIARLNLVVHEGRVVQMRELAEMVQVEAGEDPVVVAEINDPDEESHGESEG